MPFAKRRRRWISALILLPVFALAGRMLWTYHGPRAPVEIYRGIVYSCLRMPDGPESGGLLHLIRADLNAPGVHIFITPLNPQAIARGWQYRLQYTSTVVANNKLAAAVNGTLFSSDSFWIRLPGDWARASETVVADHVVSHIDPNTYLNWWDDDLIAHHELNKPPTADVLAKAKWAIGAQNCALQNGKIEEYWIGRKPDHRTMIGFDSEKRLVWLAVFDRASEHFAAQVLREQAATTAFMVDGGTSCAMAIGADARGVRSGTAAGNWRPVATHFGFYADPIKDN